MTGRTPATAAANFSERIQRCIACVSRAVADIKGGYFASAEPHALVVNNGSPVRLRGESNFYLEVALNYRIVERAESIEPWHVMTTAYFHRLLDRNQQEIIVFHWHPDQRSDVTHPHLHLGAGAEIGLDLLHRAHIPTGHITIQDVLRFAITDLGVESLIEREAALQILGETQT